MTAPDLRAVMERRLLVNYRVDPELLASLLPAPFRPALAGGYGVAGICLIRLGKLRPAGLPAVAGLRAEHAAHRVAVCWDSPGGPVTGVYIPRRDTSSRLAALAGGRLFPGWQHLAQFRAEGPLRRRQARDRKLGTAPAATGRGLFKLLRRPPPVPARHGRSGQRVPHERDRDHLAHAARASCRPCPGRDEQELAGRSRRRMIGRVESMRV